MQCYWSRKLLGFNRMDAKDKILQLKKTQDIIILAHNYQLPEIQDIADIVGDSLELAKKATEMNNTNIVFCGVDFMAESAKILNPEKNIIHPDQDAQCPMAGMVDAKSLGWLIQEHPDAEVVAYINTTAEVKALADICCTSSNGVKVVKNCKAKKIIFVPDRNLGQYIQRFINDKEMILWPGICSTHHDITPDHILELKKQHPKAEVLVHPECRPAVIDIADYVCSTNGMINHARKSLSTEFIIGTEKEHCYRLETTCPMKKFFPIKTAICLNMKKITLSKVLKSMNSLAPRVELSSDILEKAYHPLKRMMDIGRGD